MVTTPTAKAKNTEPRQMQLCEWTYGDGSKGSWTVTAWVFMEPRQLPPGFVADIRYEAWVEEFGGMVNDGYGGEKRSRRMAVVERFPQLQQSSVQALVAAGVDPLFELCKQDPDRLAALQLEAEGLAAIYEQIMLHQAAGAAAAQSSGPKRV
jgi:hypothetical protein